MKRTGLIRAAVVVPRLRIGNVEENTLNIGLACAKIPKGSIVLFPELSLTGYTLRDLFHQLELHEQVPAGLARLRQMSVEVSEMENQLIIVGAPLVIESSLYNCAVVIQSGRVLGVVPKRSLPGYKEFEEERWFASARDLRTKTMLLFGEEVPVGTDLLFRSIENQYCILAISICEDDWTRLPPSAFANLAGATIIANPSASNELVGKAAYRRSLVAGHSASGICGYLYASAGVTESTTDTVFGGHALIGENGSLLAEGRRFSRNTEIAIADIDIDRLMHDRIKTTSFGENVHEMPGRTFRYVDARISEINVEDELHRSISPTPFLPHTEEKRTEVCDEIINIQAHGLAKRLESSGMTKPVIGVSGGLDSTSALLACARAVDILEIPRKNINAITMPGFGTTKRTKHNAVDLSTALHASLKEISIVKDCEQHFRDIGHDGRTPDICFENVQARARTRVLFSIANKIGGLVVGTGDLSELAVGWCTYNADHMSSYNPNCGVPKTLVKYLVETHAKETNEKRVREILLDIAATPVSPELLPHHRGKLVQKTDDTLGPAEPRDFFLYEFVRWGTRPYKILWLATHAFEGLYTEPQLRKWLVIFLRRFFNQQWKRSAVPDGPKIGSVGLSPRADWRMPSDAEATLWLSDLHNC